MKTCARASFLPFSPPAIGEEEIAEVVSALRSDWITTGPRTKRFEAEFRDFVGAPAALALNSCTAALHVALLAAGVGPGDEVVTTPMTFCASVNVIVHVGAVPVLADVEPETLNISIDAVADAVTPRTKAVIAVHYAGHPVDLRPLRRLCADRGLTLIHDAAHALPATCDRQLIGSGGDIAAFSFYATKNLTTAEGGMLTGPPDLVDRARVLGLHGMSRDAWKRYDKGGSWRYDVVAPGFKYNMTDIQASIGLVQLRKLARMQERRRAIVAAYHAAFADVAALELPVERPGVGHAWHLYVLRLRPGVLTIDRDRFIDEMTARNIGTSVHFIPIHLHPYYREKYGYRPDDLPVAFGEFQRMLSLPLNPRMTDDDVADVIAAVRDVCERCRR